MKLLNSLAMIALIAAVQGHWLTAAASGDAGVESVRVVISPEKTSARVGAPFEVIVTVINDGEEPTTDLAVHIDLTDPSGSGSVDPEDWTPTLTRAVGPLAPGESTARKWTLEPVSGGDFVLFATVLRLDSGAVPTEIAVSNGVPIHSDESRGFNPQGVLPVILAMPLAIAALLALRSRPLHFRRLP